MQDGIHPKYGELVILFDSGEEFKTNSAKPGKYMADVDFRQHPAWNKNSVAFVNTKDKEIEKFNNKFGDFLGGF
jgi:large subunit ribosomal protein L31